MNRSRKRLALLVCIGFAAFLLAAFAFIALEAGHDCSGEDCDICAQIAGIRALLSHSALLWMVFAGTFALFRTGAFRFIRLSRPSVSLSPVSLKVRMND